MGTEIVKAEPMEITAMSVASVKAQVNLIQQVMREVMREGEHYGVIPGCKKPSLLKPGAEKLGLTFRLSPTYQVESVDLGSGHREARVVCTLTHSPSGIVVGQGVGSCSTMESKYRYRGGEKIPTSRPVPREYWNLKDEGKMDEALALIGGRGFGVGKHDGAWVVCEMGEKQENPDIADTYNTVLKMAKKRAHVDAALTATAASDIFTQDMEDMPAAEEGAQAPTRREEDRAPKREAPRGPSRGTGFTVLKDPIPKDYKDKKDYYKAQGFGCKTIGGKWTWVRYHDAPQREPGEDEVGPPHPDDIPFD